MDLSAILKKTKDRSQKITTQRKPASIAIEERPYSFDEIPFIERPSPLKIQRQIEDKIETIANKFEEKRETKERQIEDISQGNNFISVEIGDTIRDNNGDKVETKSVQESTKIMVGQKAEILLTPFSSLVGLQRKIILFFYDECKLTRSKVTQPITMEYIINSCGSTLSSIKKSIQRLELKGIIFRTTYKRGRSGWTRYELNDQVYNEILYSENYRPGTYVSTDFRDKLETKLGTNMETTAPSSSSYKTTTTTIELPDEWKKIDLSPLSRINFGLTELKNIYKKCPAEMTPNKMQDSINQFAYGLTNNPDRYKSMHAPVAILVKTLSEGTMWKENGYVSPEEKLRSEKESKITNLIEQQFKQPKFLDWFNTLSDEEKENLVPDVSRNVASYLIAKVVIQKEHALKYFENAIWPSLLLELKNAFNH